MEPKPFVVYKSSAGSGKTYTLVKEYLKIILQDPQKIRNILAITFTNAAAAEMKERIIEALGRLSALAGKTPNNQDPQSLKLLENIQGEIAMKPTEIIRNARHALTIILHNYGDFSVSTIDSFAHKIIRSFAFDLRLPVHFDVELDQSQLLTQSIDLLVSRTGSEAALTRLLVDYIESRTDDEKSHYIEYDMAQLAKTLMDEKGSLYIDSLREVSLEDFSEIHRNLNQGIGSFEEDVRTIASHAMQLIRQEGIAPDMFYRGKQGIAAYFQNLTEGMVSDKIVPNSYVQKTIDEDKWIAGKADASAKSAIEAVSGKLREYYLQIQSVAEERLDTYKVQKLIKKHLFPMAVLCELENVMDEIKSENALLHISDFNKKISEIVAVESAPFIYERIGERYYHFMIDEFQDTSGLQWQNLLPLVDNSLASGHKNLVVGDGKQAIYRWRNGDVEQFASLPQIPQSIQADARPQWEQTLQRNYQEKPLRTNWRSLPEIIAFNNSFFEFAKTYLPDTLSHIYDDQRQETLPDKTGGYVSVEFVEASQGEENGYVEQTHSRILQVIHELKQNNHPLSDISILCRSNHEASQVARFLVERGLNVISSESLLLNQSPKVGFMLSVMRLMMDPNDEVSLTAFLHFMIKEKKTGESMHQLLCTLKHSGGPDAPQKGTVLEKLGEYMEKKGFDFSFGESGHLGLYELGENIIRSFFGQGPPDPFLAFFMDVLFDYSNKYVNSVSDFLEWWQDNAGKYSVVVPEGVDAVQVMTIHKSKGLQFPVVIYPFADKDFSRPGKEGEWVKLEGVPGTGQLEIAWLSISKAMEGTPYQEIWEKEMGKTLLDLLNTVYVAFTRAVQKLFVFTKYPRSGKFSSKNFAGFLQQYLVEKGLWNDQQRVFDFGENTEPAKSSAIADGETSSGEYDTYISRSWADKITVRSRQLEQGGAEAASTERGSFIHQVMERIHAFDDVNKVLDQLQTQGQVDDKEKDKLQETIAAVLQLEPLKPLYRRGVKAKNECGMYDRQGRFFRADRVVFEKDRVVIIDFKTGHPHPSHRKQIQNYGRILQDMGYMKIERYLVYLDLCKLELV